MANGKDFARKWRLTFFFGSLRHFDFLNCERTETSCAGNSTMVLRRDILEQATLAFLLAPK